ncbi:MAG: lipid A export permease/ATP-binding protein MsbA [Gammaproteobacteria bacterium]
MTGAPEIKDGMAIYRRLLAYVKAYLSVFIIAALCMAIYAATDTSFAALMKPMLDGSFIAKDPTWIKLIPFLVILILVVRGITGFISSYAMTWMGRKVIKRLRSEMFEQLLRSPATFYDNNSSGKLISKMTYDVEQVAHAATQAITVIIRDSLTVVGLLAWMFYLNWMLSLIFLVIGPFISMLVLFINKRFRRISSHIQSSMGDVTHVTEEAIEAHRVIKIFGGRPYEETRFESVNECNRKQHMKMSATSAASVPIIQLITAIALSFIIYLATQESVQDKITVGGFMSFFLAMMLLLPPIKRLTTINVSIQRGIAAAKSIFDLLDCDAEKNTGTTRLDCIDGAVEYKNIWLTYDAEKGAVLEDVSFRVEPGQTVAFVGRSGSGKTSLISLLPRFYESSDGVITIDGHDIRSVDLDNLRDHVSLVGQDVTLFNDTIYNNIAYGKLGDVNEDEVVAAIQAANAFDFIDALPEKLDTLVGENGTLLSGGQRQRIAIARALLKNSPILILDEATSSLDSESERHIQAALDKLMQNRTTFVIAHRLSTIEKADNIIVLDSGRIVESGRHDSLLEKGGYYANLHRLQFHPDQQGDADSASEQ